ncbi:MAG: hypothetical protein J5851_04820 [Oscillospiraceae bacterium]|nr:hypothetical protein [Oscillospiraceae bacterium]
MKTIRRITAFCTSILMAAAAIPAFSVQADETLPASYDLRTKGLVSSVKDKMQYETSWAFSALNSIETTKIANNPDIDLSEWHLAYYTYSKNFGYPYSTESLFNASTYDAQQETGILTSWIGPVSEKNAPMYGDESITNSMLTMDDVRAEAEYHVTDALNLEYDVPDDAADLGNEGFAKQRELIKDYIYNGNAVDMSFIFWSPCHNFETNAYRYSTDLEDADYADSAWHSVSIVGWDDSFAASNFTTDPGMDGAWLCKDCRGVQFGDNGYFWLSYADASMDDIYIILADSAENDSRLYQHDDFGNTGKFAYDIDNGDTSVMAANVFTAEADGWLTSIMFCNVEKNTDVEFVVYTGLTDENNPISGKANTPFNAYMTMLGYQTLPLDQPIYLQKGERFSITAKISGEEAASRIPCEFATHTVQTHSDGTNEAFDSAFTLEMLERDFAAGQSFYSADGTYWFDMYNVEPKKEMIAVDVPLALDENGEPVQMEGGMQTTETTMRAGNICMKAVTCDAGSVEFSNYDEMIGADEKIALTNHDQAPIYYSLDGIHYELYEEPIALPEGKNEMDITAYADMAVVGKDDDKIKYSQHYSVRKAAISSLLCKDASYSDYAYADRADATILHYSIPAGTKSIDIIPMTTGTLTIGEKNYISGETITLPVDGKDVTINVAGENMEPMTYTLKLDVLGAEPTQPDVLLGDLNADGIVNASDAAQILIAAATLGAGEDPGLSEAEQFAADVNGDGTINASDAAVVLIYAAAIGAGQDVKIEDFVK